MIRADDFLKKIKNLKITVIGDIILDEYIFGEVERISPEAPVPVVRAEKNLYNLGGAANVALNIKSLGAEPLLIGVIGKDSPGERVIQKLKEKKINTDYIIVSGEWKTIVKSRIIAQNQQILRIDYENNMEIKGDVFKKFLESLEKVQQESDAFLIQDYEKGLLFKKTIKEILEISKNKPVFVDPKFENFFLYKNVYLFKPNLKEVEKSLGKRVKDDAGKITVLKNIKSKIKCKNIVMTMGEKGMLGIDSKNRVFKIPSIKVEVYDVTGAGDTVISLLSLALCSKSDIIHSCIIATIGAGIEVTKLGASSITKSELTDGFKNFYNRLFKQVKFLTV